MMHWRHLLAALLGILLLLPLAWTLHTAMLGGVRPTPQAKVVPMLSPGERQSLKTYERPCESRKDCEPPLACFFNPRSMWRYCTDSRCMTDQHCSEDMVCRTVETLKGARLLRQCTLVGVRREGEPCADMMTSREAACERGLLCQSEHCGRPCRVEEPGSCPEGFFCREGLDGPSCLPTCEGRACPEGQDCVRLEEGVSVCAQVHGHNCQRTPCPEGQKCSIRNTFSHPNEAWGTCLIRCGDEHTPPCPEGFVCEMKYCRKSCDPAVPNACGPHYKCHRYSEEYAWACEPDM
ncbi:hypothetical protein ACN28E_53165 [Archangium lansingense]|uniref:hypothetical protein n=1 Tax=Archangium lansingense TaxID=2995310 RepID=UPI003B76C41D